MVFLLQSENLYLITRDTMKTTRSMGNTKRLSNKDMRRKLSFAVRRAGFRHMPADHVWEKIANGLRLTILEADAAIFTTEISRHG